VSIESEKRAVETMIRLYCRDKHESASLCEACTGLLTYAHKRLTACRHGDKKPKCRNCTTHCYEPQMRKQISAVMRYAGPRMALRHPVIALKHVLS
jgi:hypothetical protein